MCPSFNRKRLSGGLFSRRGSILVAVLGCILLLAAILTAFLEEATSKIKYFGLFYQRDDLRAHAYSALDVSLAVISEIREIDGQLWGPHQGWSDPLGYAEVTFPEELSISIRFEDESAKIPLRNAPPEVIQYLLEELEVEFSVAQELTDTLFDWTDADDLHRLNGFDGDDYEDRDPPYRAPNAPVQSWDEIRLIEGWGEYFFDEDGRPLPRLAEFRRSVSLYAEEKVNLNTANPLVLNVISRLAGISTAPLSDFRAGRDLEPGTSDDRVLIDTSDPLIADMAEFAGITIDTLLVEVEVSRGEASFLLSAIVRYSGANPGAQVGREAEQPRDPNLEPDANSRHDRNQRATAPRRDMASDLGYPFTVVRLVENAKIGSPPAPPVE